MKPSIKKRILKNWPLKLVSLTIALIVWLLLVPEDKISSEIAMAIPLETVKIPAGLELTEKPIAYIDITIRAPNRVLKEINPQSLKAVLDLEKATVYQHEFPLNTGMVLAPKNVKVIKVSPNKVSLKLERTKEESLEIKPAILGKPAEGFRVSKIEVMPPRASVVGPESSLRKRESVITTPIDLSGLNQTTVFDVDIILPKPELRLRSSFTSVRVIVNIEPDKPGVKAVK